MGLPASRARGRAPHGGHRLQVSHGLSVNDYEALELLAHAEGRRLRRVDLANALQLTRLRRDPPAGRPGGQGLVRKQACSTDGRVSYAELTKAGRRRLEEASSGHTAMVTALFEERYTAQELALLAELLPGSRVAAEALVAHSSCAIVDGATNSPGAKRIVGEPLLCPRDRKGLNGKN